MTWINVFWLGSGLGIGFLTGWLWKQSQIAKSDISHESTTDSSASLERLKQIELAYQMAVEMSQFKAGFLARTSHELRSPLNGLIGAHQLILSDLCDSPEEERSFVAQAHESALKLVHLLDEIISVAKAEHGTSEFNLQPVSLTVVLKDVYELTHLLAENRNLKFHLALPDSDCYALADPRWLKQVLVSLISHAIDLMPDGKISVWVQLSSDYHFAQICIEDERPAAFWQESIDFLNQSPLPSFVPVSLNEFVNQRGPLALKAPEQVCPPLLHQKLSPNFLLLLNQTVIEQMNGRLELLATPSQPGETVTRLQCSIPLSALEVD